MAKAHVRKGSYPCCDDWSYYPEKNDSQINKNARFNTESKAITD
jgi:hypothetical protein